MSNFIKQVNIFSIKLLLIVKFFRIYLYLYEQYMEEDKTVTFVNGLKVNPHCLNTN